MTIPEYHCTEGHAIQPADWLMVEAYRCRIKDLEELLDECLWSPGMASNRELATRIQNAIGSIASET